MQLSGLTRSVRVENLPPWYSIFTFMELNAPSWLDQSLQAGTLSLKVTTLCPEGNYPVPEGNYPSP